MMVVVTVWATGEPPTVTMAVAVQVAAVVPPRMQCSSIVTVASRPKVFVEMTVEIE